jgi:hypothetical protein
MIGYLPNGQDAGVWRYTDFLKFLDLLQRRALWFTRVDQLDDPCEGRLTKPTERFYSQRRRETGFRGGSNQEALRKMRCVNCWHINLNESAAMWKVYSTTCGVALRSRISRFETAFTEESPGGSWGVRSGPVTYGDFERDQIARPIEDGGGVITIGEFMWKRASFDYEREYRLCVALEDHERQQIGKHVAINLEKLIEGVYVSPAAPRWVFEVVRKEVQVHGLSTPVISSPLYTLK